MKIDEILPESEADLLTTLLKLPYHKRIGYGLRLVTAHRDNPSLLSLIGELLSTTLLPDRVPFPGKEQDDGYITLLFPQSTASKRFFQRELGLAMASALGQRGVPFLLDAIIHASTAGKSRAIMACVSPSTGATDTQLVETYHKSVPATRESLQSAMVKAGRVEALKTLHLWKEPPPPKIVDPRCVVLERDLKSAIPQDRDEVWTRAGLSLFRLHRHLHNPTFVLQDSQVDLVTTIFDLLERYPPPHLIRRFDDSQVVPSVPSSLDRRLHSFLLCDLPRTLRLVRRTCYIPDPKNKGRDLLKLPSSFMHHKSSSQFWHMLSVKEQTEHLLPFIVELMQIQNQVLLKNGQLRSADLLRHARWQIVIAVAESALASLESARVVKSMSLSERYGIIDFVVHAIDILSSRLFAIAHREGAFLSQTLIEEALERVIVVSVERILAVSRVSAPSDEAFVKSFTKSFIFPVLEGPLKKYPPLAEVLFNNIKGIFDIAQVSKSELVSTASQFFKALKRKRPSVFNIPDNGVVQPYCGIREMDNDAVFHLLLRLEHPRSNPSFYVNSVINELLEHQREVLWTYFNDPEYTCAQLLNDGSHSNLAVFVNILTELPATPRVRLPIVRVVLDHPKIDDSILAGFYPLLDISDAPSRELLQKNTYKRLFTDRYQSYRHLMMATWSHKPREYIATMKFLIPRIKNEILPDAQLIPGILDKDGVDNILPMWDQATDGEAREMAGLYLAWEKQNNEAVSRVIPISAYVLRLASLALTHYAGSPAHPFFHFGMDLLWVREVYEKGPLKAHETYSIEISTTQSKLTEDEEIKRRQFILASKDSLGETGYWRISDERQFTHILLEQYHSVHKILPFERSAAYPAFISILHKLLGIRCMTVPVLRDYTEDQLDILRGIAGSKGSITDWKPEAQRTAISYILRLRALYGTKVTLENLPWWSEFRRLRLSSTDAFVEVNLLHEETFDSEGKQNQQQLDNLVENLLRIDDSAVHLSFVRLHLMENRQDLLKDAHITGTLVGLFNQLPADAVARPPPWEFTFPRRFYPRQCELFAVKLLETIHSGEVPLHSQVKAAEDFTKLPTTTIIELAELLKEDLNQRVVEAILMFLPRLDEPASGTQFLLAPSYLDGDLARTAVFSIRGCLQHVPADNLPKILIPVFPPENSKRRLKITVMKELVRLVCQHASHEDFQSFLMKLWSRRLHQDVRIAFLQSVISFLGSKQENLAWAILRDAVSNPSLVLDDALFALLAVEPANPYEDESDIQVVYRRHPEILTDMAENTIPEQCHHMYTEDVLYPLSQLWSAISVSSLNLNEKEAKLVRERLRLLQKSGYNTIFLHFLTARNANTFARRAFDAAKSVALSDAEGVDFFQYFVYGIGKCVALDPRCWDVLCQLVDFLAGAVGSPREPTEASLKAIRRLHAMNLSTNMTFQSPDLIRQQLTVDRMSLLEPLARHGCDHFAKTFWERRFHLFSCERRRALSQNPNGVLTSELDEVRSLLLDLIRLSEELQCSLTHLKSKIAKLFIIASSPVADELVEELLSGRGIDFIWINELRLEVLSQRVRKTVDYARSLAAFHTLISNYHSSFYVQHWMHIKLLVASILTPDTEHKSVPKELASTLLDPIFDRAESSALDSRILHRLLDTLPDVMLCHRPLWVIERICTMLFSVCPWESNSSASRSALPLVEFVNTTSVRGNSTTGREIKVSDVSPLAALLVEAIYSGALRNFDLGNVISNSAQKIEPVLSYPYFVTSQDDGSGGDMEDRRSKATVPQLLDRFQAWKLTHASQYLSDAHQPQIPPSMLAILHQILGRFPRLVLVHPSLFLSYAASTFGQPDLDTEERTRNVLSHLKNALVPNRQGESGTRWGWAPPLSLTLSFAHILFTETANEILEAVLDDYADVGSITCKLAALELLDWWKINFYGIDTGQNQLVKSMEQGEGRENIMKQYDELRVLACGDESRVVREKAFMLSAGDKLARA